MIRFKRWVALAVIRIAEPLVYWAVNYLILTAPLEEVLKALEQLVEKPKPPAPPVAQVLYLQNKPKGKS